MRGLASHHTSKRGKGLVVLIWLLLHAGTVIRWLLSVVTLVVALYVPEGKQSNVLLLGEIQYCLSIIQSEDFFVIVVHADHRGKAKHFPQLAGTLRGVEGVQLFIGAVGSLDGVLQEVDLRLWQACDVHRQGIGDNQL